LKLYLTVELRTALSYNHASEFFHLSGHLGFTLVPRCPDNRGTEEEQDVRIIEELKKNCIFLKM